MVRKFPPFRSKRKKRSTSEGTPQFPNGITGKLPYHLTSNRNFRIFWPNGKHPKTPDQRSQRDCSEEKFTTMSHRCVDANCRNVVDLSKCILVHNIPFFGD